MHMIRPILPPIEWGGRFHPPPPFAPCPRHRPGQAPAVTDARTVTTQPGKIRAICASKNAQVIVALFPA